MGANAKSWSQGCQDPGTAPGHAGATPLPFTCPAMLSPRRQALGMRLRRRKAEAVTEAPGFYLPACRHRLPRLMKAGRIKGVQGRVWGGARKACAR